MTSLSELLNPVTSSKSGPLNTVNMSTEDSTTVTFNDEPTLELAPELFEPSHTNDAMDLAQSISPVVQRPNMTETKERKMSVSQPPMEDFEPHQNSDDEPQGATGEKRTKRAVDKKDTRHSSKNEGQHTDRRYLCYLCNKLFTRRRSVRDHLSKIHGTKTWEPSRSLEIIVEPETGEPTESLEIQIARGGAAPAPPPRISKRQIQEEDEEQVQEEPESDIEKPIEPVVEKPEPVTKEVPAEEIVPVMPVPAPVIGKKRPLPINKKGMAKIKTSTPNKRPRLVESESRTPIRSPSVASIQRTLPTKMTKATESPVSSRAQSIGASESATPSAGSPESGNDDDGEVFCICRKGDNHTWMIACDGGCEEWYHGRCVNIRERDGDLIDKYVCPKCANAGFHTTWKRMCRRKGCRKPARVFQNPASKYCSPECGRLFFVDLIKRGDRGTIITRNGQFVMEMEKAKKRRRKRHRTEKKKRGPGELTPLIDGSRPHTPAYSDDEKSEYETDSSLDDDQLPNRGGALRAGELKTVLGQCTNVEDFRALGRKPATPPRGDDIIKIDVDQLDLDMFEKVQILAVEEEKDVLVERGQMLAAKEELLELIKKRSVTIVEEVKKANPKQKDLCGFDPRLSWSDAEFLEWLEDQGGADMLKSGKIGPPPAAGDEKMTNGHVDSDDEDASGNSMPTKGGVCIKNRCQRHGSNRWQKAQLAELRFEQDLVRKDIERFEKMGNRILESANVRKWSAQY